VPEAMPFEAEVAVVGAGPAGIIVALELARRGHDVVLVESGGREPDATTQRLGDTVGGDPRHVEMELATSRRLGGASNMWGGRCVPFDPVDFEPRPGVGEARWPVDHAEVAGYFGRACEWCRCGAPTFTAAAVPELADRAIVPGFRDGEVRASDLERWSLPTNFGAVYGAELEATPNLRLLTGRTCVEVVPAEGGSEHGGRSVSHLVLRDGAGTEERLRARRYVLAAGGLESTRLLLASRSRDAEGIGAHSGHLGRWYMAHVEARVARVRFAGDPGETIYSHERDGDGVYIRRRFTIDPATQAAEGLPNVAIWLVNPSIADPGHGSAVLSFVYLMLVSPLGGRFVAEGIRRAHTEGDCPGGVRAHLRNVVRDLPRAARFAVAFGYGRFLRRGRKVPGFYVPSAANVYPLLYHAEHLPHRESEVTLSEEHDALGMPRLRTRLHFSEADVEAVRRAHEVLDRSLRAQGLGEVEFLDDDVEAAVRAQLFGGYHQAGTTRMSAEPADGVLDRDLAVHGFDDLFVASSSAFPTSGQANSTFTLTAFAVRLADHLATDLAATPAAPPVAIGAAS
jgi:choline dehydrogenase-like flavoprotein